MLLRYRKQSKHELLTTKSYGHGGRWPLWYSEESNADPLWLTSERLITCIKHVNKTRKTPLSHSLLYSVNNLQLSIMFIQSCKSISFQKQVEHPFEETLSRPWILNPNVSLSHDLIQPQPLTSSNPLLFHPVLRIFFPPFKSSFMLAWFMRSRVHSLKIRVSLKSHASICPSYITCLPYPFFYPYAGYLL